MKSILKLAVAVALLFGALGFTSPAAAYRECTPEQNYACSHMGGPPVQCSPFHYCFKNSCYASCSGFTGCIDVTSAQCPF
jgi:hypothetical protein